MKKYLAILVLGLLFFSTVNSEERESELNNLFKQLKNSEIAKAIEIENKIWKIWSTHPSNAVSYTHLTLPTILLV